MDKDGGLQQPTRSWSNALGVRPGPGANRARIEAALRAAGGDKPPPETAEAREALLRQAAGALIRDGHPAGAADLCAASGPAKGLVRLYLRALRETGDPARLAAAAAALTGRDDLDDATRALLRQIGRAPAAAAAATQGLPLPGPIPGLLADPRIPGPEGIPAATAAAIVAALDRVAAAQAERDRPAGRAAQVVMAARDLHGAGDMLGAALLASAVRETAGGAKLLLWTLGALQRDALLQELLVALAERRDLPEDVVNLVYTQRVRLRVDLGPEDQRRFWGAPGPDLPATLAALDRAPAPRPFAAALAERLAAMRAAAGITETAADLEQRLAWGFAAEMYLRFLIRARRPPGRWRDADGDTRAFQTLCAEMDDILLDETAAPLAAAQAAGGSIVITRAHAGTSCYFARQFADTGLPVIAIAANAGGEELGRAEDGPTLFSTRGEFKAGFVKLVKSIRKTPSFVSIFPDGGYGGDLLPFDLLGARIRLGQGAATLAWHGRAHTFFYRPFWQDRRRLLTRLIPGPRATDFTERADFDAAFYTFYLDQLRQIVLGPPEDMVGSAGFWPMLLEPAD